jgi:DNA-binding response OmpR family regulator
MAKILLVDDDEATNYALSEVLKRTGHEVLSSFDGKSAQAVLKQQTPDLLITDIFMENDGIELLTWLRTVNKSLPVIVISGGSLFDDYEGILKFMGDFGGDLMIRKPLDFMVLDASIQQLLTEGRPSKPIYMM